MAEGESKQQTANPAPLATPAVPTNPAVIMATQPPPDWRVDPSLPTEWGDVVRPDRVETYGPPSPNANTEEQNRYSRPSDSASFPVTDPGANQPETGLPGLINNGIPIPGGNRVEIRGRKPTLVFPF